jgi:hypothetical protein
MENGKKCRGLSFHIGPHFATYWWGGEIGYDDKTTWPLWYISWGGRGREAYGCGLFAAKVRIGWKYYGIHV